MKSFPARLHVLLARDAHFGLVIRRGPSKQVATFLWNRKSDTFKLGQWLKGRIYERRCELSPDGKYFIYFAMNGRYDSVAQGAWTAISISPYLKALAIFPKGDCWNGGGLWVTKSTYWLNDGFSAHSILRNTTLVQRDEHYEPVGGANSECLSVYYPRLRRDGWTLVDDGHADGRDLTVFEKAVGLNWTLRKYAHAIWGAPAGKGSYWDEHELFNSRTKVVVKYPTWEWADLDGNRIVWAEGGALKAAQIGQGGLEAVAILQDFNEMKFQPILAPY